MISKLIVSALIFLAASVCYADTSVCSADPLITVKTKSLSSSSVFEASVRDSLSKALNKRCSVPERITAPFRSELQSYGYVASPEDSFFAVEYIFNKNFMSNQLITASALSSTEHVPSRISGHLSCGHGTGVDEKRYVAISQRRLSGFFTASNRVLNEQEQGSGLFLLVVQPSLEYPGKKNIFHCTTLNAKSL
ncbi:MULTISPECIES: hypothetical protein [unclassified Endozoicomonas]|uniref:hypothetical protein n=1 Tax=unclassified Endozoicomonas TaxID=2644528 RepID=UPI0021476FB8|nr:MULTISPECIES: hypothetical protein [unclassified Endozoicomonas]